MKKQAVNLLLGMKDTLRDDTLARNAAGMALGIGGGAAIDYVIPGEGSTFQTIGNLAGGLGAGDMLIEAALRKRAAKPDPRYQQLELNLG